MPDKKRWIGVCLTEAHSYLNTGFLSELNAAAAARGYGVVLFNTTPNPYRVQGEENASRTLYRAIQFSLFDAIVIIYYSFRDPQLLSEIVSGARRRSVPVISIGAELPDCYSIVNSSEESYRRLIRHVIVDHGAANTVFMAGAKGEPNADARLECYRKVLEECSLPFSEEQVLPADYVPDKARKLTRALAADREHLPRAIFCVNDDLALVVCDTLRENGIRVPEDVIVTGFDGTPAAYMVHPRLTTCCDDPKVYAEQTMEIITKLKKGGHPPRRSVHTFRAVLSESCGCHPEENRRFSALTLFRRSQRLNSHENDLSLRMNILTAEKDPQAFWNLLSQTILPDSVIHLNRSFMDIFRGKDYHYDGAENDIVTIPSRGPDDPYTELTGQLDRLPIFGGPRTGTHVLNVIYADNMYCGVYDVHTNDPEGDAQLIKRMSDNLNVLFTMRLGMARQQMLITDLNNTLYLDAATRFSNLRGLNRWFGTYNADPANHARPLSLTVYSVNHYSYIFETYGMAEIESIISLVSNRLSTLNREALIIARVSDEQFVVVSSADTLDALRADNDRRVNPFFRNIEAHNAASSKPYYIEVNCGCTVMDSGWANTTLEGLIHLALGEMYLNNMRTVTASREAEKPSAGASVSMYSAFNLLMEKNLMRFHYQPIVSARSAQIVAYEALMRTDRLIHMSPLDILSVAREYNQLYEVERMTVFGIMEQYVQNYSAFSGCRVFINTIPGYFLNEDDCAALKRMFEGFLNFFVFELTEQASTSDEELARIRSLGKADSPTQIAIDDYGTGHSNMVNVLRYAPQIIKIDRALISGIQNDSNKQLFVRNTIDFAHQNNIRVLAEGVETAEELRSVIDYGVDYIQGYFTGRPVETPLRKVADDVRNIILEENLTLRRLNHAGSVHTAGDGDSLDLIALSLEGCSCVQITGGSVTLTGHPKQNVVMIIRVAEGAAATLTLVNAALTSADESILQLGQNSSLTLVLKGDNHLDKEGIHVLPGAKLTVTGDGNLSVENTRNFAIGIGANFNDPYGTIVLDLEGALSIRSTGDRVVCLGGGRSAGEGIRFLRGSCSFRGNGITALGIGSTTGDAQVDIGEDASVSVVLEGNEAVGVGTLNGEASLRSAGHLEIDMKCERCVGLGSMAGSGQILLDGGVANVIVRCDQGSCVGSYDGETTAVLRNTAFTFHGEGNKVAGLGSVDGACDTRIESGHVSGDILAAEDLPLGNPHSRVIVTGGNVLFDPSREETPVSPGGLPLRKEEPEGDHYEKSFRDKRGSWTYIADRDEDGRLAVWIPEEN